MPRLTVEVTVEMLSTETGVWCDRCALPSAFTIVMAVSIGKGFPSLMQRTACLDCGSSD